MAAAQILCTKCGTASTEATAACAKCGGKNARVCACGHMNSVAKNFCDKCGQPLAAPGAAAPPPPARVPGAPGSEIPSTAVYRLPTPGESAAGGAPAGPGAPPPTNPFQLPTPAQGSNPLSASDPAFDNLWGKPPAPTPAAPRAATAARRPTKSDVWQRVANAAGAIVGLVTAASILWYWQESRRPEVVVPKLGAVYLEALRGQDYARAYALFSDEARRSCTLQEFAVFRDTTPWTWSKLRIEHQEPGAILLAYELQAQGLAPRTDHLLFTEEGRRWTRPYNWVLMRKVEEAFARGDADGGMLMAQVAATIDPRDPLAWSYLCQGAYYRKAPQDAELRCRTALELARTYPSNLTLKSLYHLHAILADTYRIALASPDKAIGQYTEMLAFPNISPEDQCEILLARAQVYKQLSRPGEELTDLNRGASFCANPADQLFIQKMREAMRAPVP